MLDTFILIFLIIITVTVDCGCTYWFSDLTTRKYNNNNNKYLRDWRDWIAVFIKSKSMEEVTNRKYWKIYTGRWLGICVVWAAAEERKLQEFEGLAIYVYVVLLLPCIIVSFDQFMYNITSWREFYCCYFLSFMCNEKLSYFNVCSVLLLNIKHVYINICQLIVRPVATM